MTRPEMLLRLVRKALWVRPGKLALSVLALTVGATLSSAFLSLYFDLPAKMSAEFRTLGPNLIVAPRGAENTFSAQLEDRLATAYPALARLPWLYAVGQAGDRNVVLAGSRLEDLAAMHPSWRGIPSHPGEGLLAGETAAALLGWKIGETHRISYAGRQINLPLAGIVSTGGSEDSQLLLPLATLQNLTRQPGQLSLLQLAAPGRAQDVEATWHNLAADLGRNAKVEVRALRPVLESEARVVMKVRWLMLGLSAIVLALVILSVLTNVSGRILARQKDIGVMKALGGTDAGIARLFFAESAVQALLAAGLGFSAGFALAQTAARRIFHSSLALRWDVAAAVTAITLGVALLATALPSRWIRRMEPAEILRGE